MNPEALYDTLNCLATTVLFSEGDSGPDRARQAQDALWEAGMAAADAFPAGSREAEALCTILGAVARFARGEVTA